MRRTLGVCDLDFAEPEIFRNDYPRPSRPGMKRLTTIFENTRVHRET
jgi:hypothetical protein